MNSIPEHFSQNGLADDASLSPSDAAGQLEGLAWTAQQYVLGELRSEELAAWEQRLLVDPVACEAVADAAALI